uniref:Uncharacterized protein n=1 Tax=Micrurus surinamensis TaxID=129470 RepID=A0A2D4PNJ6_MICSU
MDFSLVSHSSQGFVHITTAYLEVSDRKVCSAVTTFLYFLPQSTFNIPLSYVFLLFLGLYFPLQSTFNIPPSSAFLLFLAPGSKFLEFGLQYFSPLATLRYMDFNSQNSTARNMYFKSQNSPASLL